MPAVPSSGWRGPGSGQVPTGYRADPSGRVEKTGQSAERRGLRFRKIGGGGGRFVLAAVAAIAPYRPVRCDKCSVAAACWNAADRPQWNALRQLCVLAGKCCTRLAGRMVVLVPGNRVLDHRQRGRVSVAGCCTIERVHLVGFRAFVERMRMVLAATGNVTTTPTFHR
ncbi:MAG: hypothetical protein R2932_47655 [Caldilineaceae bacterium]